jgi:uncharacterized membrane protein YozB (DUF420 family)
MPILITSTLNLILQMAIFIILIVAIRYAKQGTKEGTDKHRNWIAVAIVLNLVGLFLVMIPSEIVFLSSPGTLAITTLLLAMAHGIFGALGLTFGIAFVFNKKPKNVRRWMRMTAAFWFIALILGFIQYINITLAP